MRSGHWTRRVALLAGAGAIAGTAALTGCSTSTKEAPTTTDTTPSATSSAPAPTPTEKAAGPGQTNSFSPTVNPVQPGASCTRIVNGVCQR